MKETVQIQQLSIGYKEKSEIKYVSRNLSATLYEGELTCLIGSNGVGKSTLLRTLSAFLPALEGEILVCGKPIKHYSNKELSVLIGIVLTDRCDAPQLKVKELVGMGRNPYNDFWGRMTHKDKEAVDQALSLVQISWLADRMIHTLSDGERQKVMIAKALAQETPIIYLDEPTAFLDFPSKIDMIRLLHRLTRQANKTIFMSSHDLELILRLADKLWLMDARQGIVTGTHDELSANGILTSFFNSDERNGLVYDIQHRVFFFE